MINILELVNTTELIEKMNELLGDHEKLKNNEDVVKLMNYIRNHFFN